MTERVARWVVIGIPLSITLFLEVVVATSPMPNKEGFLLPILLQGKTWTAEP